MSLNSLTEKGIKKIATQPQQTPTLLQVVNLQTDQKVINGEKALMSEISDGYSKLKCYWDKSTLKQIEDLGMDNFNGCVVMISKYLGGHKVVVVTEFKPIYLMKCEIGDPIPYKDYANGNMNLKSTNKILPDWIEKSFNDQKIDAQLQNNGDINAEIINKSDTSAIKRSIQKIPPSNFITQTRAPTKGIEFSSIELIYAGFLGWILYGRVTKTIYKQFINKNNKLTKLLEFQIMDRNKWTIKCTIFDKEAEKLKMLLKEKEVYLFSNGMVKLDSYKKPLHNKDSQFSIIFQEHAKISLAEDDNTIPLPPETNIKLDKLKDFNAGIQCDVVGILKSIGPEIKFVAKGRTEESTKRTIVICDPVSRIECDVTIWRSQVEFSEQMSGKTLLFQSVKTHHYEGACSLNTWAKTNITVLKDHPFNRYQPDIQNMSFTAISYRKNRQQNKAHIASMRQLLSQTENMQVGQSIWSTFRVYVNKIKETGKKWYHACPSCRKAVGENSSSCAQCGSTFEEPAVRYILNITISDSLGTGSLWTVAHDDFANKILSAVQTCSASKASKMKEEDFFIICRKAAFQEFKITMVSKAQSFPPNYNSVVRHQITSFDCLDMAKETKMTLEAIMKFC